MLEDQPLDLSVRVGDYAELTREDKDEQDQRERKDLPVDDYGNEAAALRLRGCFATTSEYGQEREDRTCSEDSDDSCSDNNQQTKDGGGGGSARSRSRPPGTKPYKKNLMRRYRESVTTSKYRCRLGPLYFPVHSRLAIVTHLYRRKVWHIFHVRLDRREPVWMLRTLEFEAPSILWKRRRNIPFRILKIR